MELRVVLEDEAAVVPSSGSALAAGFDLSSTQSMVIGAKTRGIVETGVTIALPPGHYGRIAPRSGLAARHSIDVGAGVIDEDYRGTLKVVLFNLGDSDFNISRGDRIAQLIVTPYAKPTVVVVSALEDTERGASGCGSTGVKSE